MGTLFGSLAEVFRAMPLNLLIALLAMALGTLFGALIGALRVSRFIVLRAPGMILALLCFIAPVALVGYWVMEHSLAGLTAVPIELGIPPWVLAVLLLSLLACGLVSGQFRNFLADLIDAQSGTDLRFFAAWTESAFVIFLLSMFAAFLGAPEALATARSIAANSADPTTGSLLYAALGVCLAGFGLLVIAFSMWARHRSLIPRPMLIQLTVQKRRKRYQARDTVS